MSLPSWERGLKFDGRMNVVTIPTVAPLVGAWIEIEWAEKYRMLDSVAPLVGAWIEIFIN